MATVKNCPFCGGKIEYDNRKSTIASVETKCHCTGCGMRFEYCQDFVFSKKARVPINSSFEELWNGRSESEELRFTRGFIREHGLEFALASAWNGRASNG